MVSKFTIKTNTYFSFLAETFEDNWSLCKQTRKHALICFAVARLKNSLSNAGTKNMHLRVSQPN